MRVHQWVKNILILVPLAASHKINALTVANSLLAVIAFCLLASGTYLLNDLLDLANDRDHATKRHRPLASGALPLPHGMALAPALTLVSIVLGAMVSFEFVEVLALYGVTTVAYSVYFKQRMLIDVLALAGLYSIRILAGSAAIGLPPSQWLLAFSVFVFLCLAIIKRYIELVGRLQQNAGNPRGRGYRNRRPADLVGLGGGQRLLLRTRPRTLLQQPGSPRPLQPSRPPMAGLPADDILGQPPSVASASRRIA